MIVAITGGGGFIGKQLVNRHIQQGDHVQLNLKLKQINNYRRVK
jgi:NAD dependent epimerase/dehydratase family enzyme